MLLLLTKSLPEIIRLRGEGYNVGRLYTPRHYNSLRVTNESGIPWAADNDGFNGVDERAFTRMLEILEPDAECRFVVAPDVLEDAQATMKEFLRWHRVIEDKGFPVAYVLQDGIEGVGIPWDLCSALFIGGSTEFKFSDHVRERVAEAKERGKWVHMGRVNSVRRIEYAASIGCDSVDGTQWSKFTDTYKTKLHSLRHRQSHLAEVEREGV